MRCNSAKRGLLTLVALSALSLLFPACGRQMPEANTMPTLPVSISLDLHDEGYHLQEPFSTLEISRPETYAREIGVAGVILVHGIGTHEEINDAYYAYDRRCPIEASPTVCIHRVKNKGDQSGLIIYECPKCHTQYDLELGTGHPITPRRHLQLLQYRVIKKGNTLLVIG